MTLPGSGPLSISQIAAEFGVALPCVFPDAFYGKAGLAGSGALSMSQFHGLSNAVFTPDGGSFDFELSSPASFTLTCSVPALWTYAGGGTGGSVNIPSGTMATSITFTVTAPHLQTRTATWSVNGNAGGTARDFALTLEAQGA